MEEATVHDMLARPTATLSHMRDRGSVSTQGQIKPVFFTSNSLLKLAPRVTFLDLPQHIHDQIYHEAGYGGNRFVDLNVWSSSEQFNGFY